MSSKMPWLFIMCTAVGALVASMLLFTGVVHRLELQSINRMFEARPWLHWSQSSLSKLQPQKLWSYHLEHDIPRTIYSWDYTLSWLIVDNHPSAAHKFAIFNHMIEDEPPAEALGSHSWIEPLLKHPLPRKSVADIVRFLASSGARLIILDNDFPQFDPDDRELAMAIHESTTGKFGRQVPVLMASTVNRRSFHSGMQLQAPTSPRGILAQLRKIEPDTDVEAKYTALTTVIMDEDQVIRSLATQIPQLPLATGGTVDVPHSSIAIKALQQLGESIPANLPAIMNIDFATVPNSELYPVRPLSYLLDPERRAEITSANSDDVTIKDAIVIVGDGVQDVYATPLTNVGVNLMSGSEILAHAIDTIARRSWPMPLNSVAHSLYALLCCAVSAFCFCATRRRLAATKWSGEARMAIDWALCVFLTLSTYFAGFILFAWSGLLVPVIAPAIGAGTGILAGILYERERERMAAMLQRLQNMEALINAERERHQLELRWQQARAQAREALNDQARRREFVRRINHDLKAPVTVLNWTLAKLRKEGLSAPSANDRLDNIERTSDRLFALIAELVHSYDQTGETESTDDNADNQTIDLCHLLTQCCQIQAGQAEQCGIKLKMQLPDYPLVFLGNKLTASRILDNLLSNAIVHNTPGTEVEISARTRANVHQISVADNGRGIAPHILPHIFEPGFTTRAEENGEGLGLSIAQAAIKRLGGSISVESSEDAGTTFTISLPAHMSALSPLIELDTCSNDAKVPH